MMRIPPESAERFSEIFLDMFEDAWANDGNYESALKMIMETLEKMQIRYDPILRGKRIRKARRELGMSQYTLAQKMGISQGTILYYELGRITMIPADTLERLSKILGVEI